MKEPISNKYERAKKRVEEVKGFHKHLMAYVVINIIIFLAHIRIFDFFAVEKGHDAYFGDWFGWNVLLTPLLWGIGLAFHAWRVFGRKTGFMRKWEERKIQELMDEEKEWE